MENSEIKFTRTCPTCSNIVEHLNAKQLKKAIKLNRPCVSCTRLAHSKKMMLDIICPLCNKTCKGDEEFNEHAITSHDNTGEKIHAMHVGFANLPLCRCGCGNKRKYYGWTKGWSDYLLGHWSVNLETDAVKADINSRRREALKGQVNKMKGKTSPALQAAGKRMSERLKAQFSSGERVPIIKGKTKENCEILAKLSATMKKQFASGERKAWHLGKTEKTDDRVKKKNDALRQSYQDRKLTPWLRLNKEDISKRISTLQNIKAIIPDVYQNARVKNFEAECLRCSHRFIENFISVCRDKCPKCDSSISKNQMEIADYICSLGFKTEINNRTVIKPLEIDVYIESKNFGIEHNGTYFHSELFIEDNNYHEKKSECCREKSVSLIHIFEDEWNKKSSIVKSIISSKLGKSSTNINARETKVVELTSQQRKTFFIENHLEGDVNSITAFGLLYNNEIVSAISIRKPFHKTWANHIEIGRFASKCFTNVRGGLGKLMKKVEDFCRMHKITSIMTYVDSRIGDGHGYKVLGFQQTSKTPPRFWWTDGCNRYNRFKFKADKKRNMTESQIADEAGVYKIFCCSNIVFTKQI